MYKIHFRYILHSTKMCLKEFFDFIVLRSISLKFRLDKPLAMVPVSLSSTMLNCESIKKTKINILKSNLQGANYWHFKCHLNNVFLHETNLKKSSKCLFQ
jgi:hypothetical protein